MESFRRASRICEGKNADSRFAPTLENVDRALRQLAVLIERYPYKDMLWLYADRLEAEREKLLSRKRWLEEMKGRLERSPDCSNWS